VDAAVHSAHDSLVFTAMKEGLHGNRINHRNAK
jgi:hypothetical protein